MTKKTRLTNNQLALMSAILGVSNAGQDTLFEGRHVQHTPESLKFRYEHSRRSLTVESVTTDLVGGICESDEMLDMFLEETKSWVSKLKPMSVEKIKSTWTRYAAFVECVN